MTDISPRTPCSDRSALERVPLIGTKATADFHQGAQPRAADQTPYTWPQPKSRQHQPKTLAPREPSIHGPSDNGERIFRCGGVRPTVPQMIAFIDDPRCVHGVGPICRVLGIGPSTYHASKAVERDPALASDRARQDRLDMDVIKQDFDGSRGRYGARKTWHQLRREGRDIARCTAERLMKMMGLQGVVRGRRNRGKSPGISVPVVRQLLAQLLLARVLSRTRLAVGSALPDELRQVGNRFGVGGGKSGAEVVPEMRSPACRRS